MLVVDDLHQVVTQFLFIAAYQNGHPSFQGHRTEQYEQPTGRGTDLGQRNYMHQPATMTNQHPNMGVKLEQAVFNPRGPGRGIPVVHSQGPNPAPGRDSNYMDGVTKDYASDIQGNYIYRA